MSMPNVLVRRFAPRRFDLLDLSPSPIRGSYYDSRLGLHGREHSVMVTADWEIVGLKTAVTACIFEAVETQEAEKREREYLRRLARADEEIRRLQKLVDAAVGVSPAPLESERLNELTSSVLSALERVEHVKQVHALSPTWRDESDGRRVQVLRVRFAPAPESTVDTVVQLIDAAHLAFVNALRPDEVGRVELDADERGVAE